MTTTHRQTRLLTFLDGSGHSPSEVGDKAARLDFLLGHGYPIPSAAVLTTAAYREAIQQHGLRLLAEDLQTSALPDASRAAAEGAAIERSFLSAPLSAGWERALDRVTAEVLADGPAVVRPSVVDEDLGELPAPNLYLTVAGVTNRENLDRAVRRCWASIWMPTARSYRRHRRMNDRHLAMAVIVQRMVVPYWSGVALSSDPAGKEHLLQIRVTGGRHATPDPLEIELRKDTLEPVGGGTEHPFFTEDLARLIVRIEQTCGQPQSIDWAYDSAGLTLLQVRPLEVAITQSSLDDGFDSRPGSTDTYTPHGVIEMLPGVVPPLLWTINSPMLENAFRSAFADLGGTTPPPDRPIVARFAGRAALNLSAICRVAESLPGGNPAEVERQYLGRSISADPDTPNRPQSSGVHLFAALRSRTVHKRIVDDVELIDTAARTIAGLAVALEDLPVRNLVAYRQRIRDLAWRGYAAEVGASSAAGATYRALELLLERWLPEKAATEWAQRLARTAIDRSTLGGLRGAGLVAALEKYGTEEIRDIIATTTDDPRSALVATGRSGVRFLAHLDAAVKALGSKAIYGDRLWAEDHKWIWRQLQLLIDPQQNAAPQPADQDGYSTLIELLARDRKWRRLRILTGQFVDLRARWLRRQVGETTKFLGLREQAKNALLILGGEERRIIVEAARRLVASRQLPDVGLVEYLTDAELDGMLFGSCGIERVVLQRRASTARHCRNGDPLPDWFQGDPAAGDPRTHPVTARLEGWATSPGKATGRVCVVDSLADGMRLNRGDVLVAHSTDPSWTPLFLTAAAVVLETGGPLSHASIVAREYGLPAVLSVPNATRILVDGERVLVDGTTGVVERLERGTP
jgi:pyruvate,water dikinase